MKIATMSDVHGMWDKLKYPQADVLVMAGDILPNFIRRPGDADAMRQHALAIPALNDKIKKLKTDGVYKHVIVVAGNHDWAWQYLPQARTALTDAIYLQDSEVVIDGVKFYGSPWTRWFYDWAFNFPNHHQNFYRARAHARDCWEQIPEDTDVLITHGPPLGILDTISPGAENLGDTYLTDRLKTLKPKLHVFGHIHGSSGVLVKDSTVFVNASVCTEHYQPINEIKVIDI